MPARPLSDLCIPLPLPQEHATRLIALVGGGGKTTLMFALAHALIALGHTVLTTTSTHILAPTAQQSPLLLLTSEANPAPSPWDTALFPALKAALHRHRHITLAQSYRAQGLLQGLSPVQVDALAAAHTADYILVEADGAALHPLKAPAPHEPAVPRSTDLCLAVLGLDGVGQSFVQALHRAPLGAALCGAQEQDNVEPEHLAHLALHPQGLFRTTGAEAQRTVVCNKADLFHRADALSKAFTAYRAGLLHYPHAACSWCITSAREGWAMPIGPPTQD